MNNVFNWNPDQYLKFDSHRLRPALDLIAQIPASQPKTIFDLGCGPGNITRLLADRWPEAAVTGVDSSPDMLSKAAEEKSRVIWREGNIADFKPESPADVIFSNAALHWLDDHAALFPRLLTMLNPGGVLAVQMPRNHGAPSHTLMADVARSGPWASMLESFLRETPVAGPEVYYDYLAAEADRVDIWESEYAQVLEGDNPVLEWVRGTALKSLLDAFNKAGKEAWAEEFVEAYAARLLEAYPRRSDGRTLFPFRRLFIVAIRR